MDVKFMYILNVTTQNYLVYITIFGVNVWTLNFINQPIKIQSLKEGNKKNVNIKLWGLVEFQCPSPTHNRSRSFKLNFNKNLPSTTG